MFGLLTACFAMLPMGAWFAFGTASLVLLVQGDPMSAAALIGYGTKYIMIIGDNFVQPALISGGTELPFLATLIGILAGLEAFGLIGLFLGPAIIAILLAVVKEWMEEAATVAAG